ncbi:hypothetical protein B0G84_7512 [Paraburkholderia sp. BL8N3]|nr:hypothetical protein B0G84_7512 [Paraburkholderia sp. BL8N3]
MTEDEQIEASERCPLMQAKRVRQKRSRCTGSYYLDTVLRLRRPLSWWLPDGIHGVT